VVRAALLAPTRSPDAAGTVAVGTALTLATLAAGAAWVVAVAASPLGLALTPAVAVPGAILRGYRLRVIATPATATTPSFVRWGGLLRSGLRSYLLTALYVLPWIGVVLAVLVAGGATAGGLPESLGEAAAAVALLVAVGVAAVGAAAVAYALPAAQATLAAEGSLRAALSPIRVGSVALRGAYAGRWALAAVVAVVGALAAVVLTPLLVGLVVPFYAKVVVASLVGAGAADALADETAAPAVDPETDDPAPRAEAPAAVQAGRGVPLDDERGGDGVGIRRGDADDDESRRDDADDERSRGGDFVFGAGREGEAGGDGER